MSLRDHPTVLAIATGIPAHRPAERELLQELIALSGSPEQLLQLLCGHGVKAAVIWIPCGFGIAHCHDPLSFIVRSDVTER